MKNKLNVSSKYLSGELTRAGLEIFRSRDVSNLLNVSKDTAYRKVKALARAGFAERVRNGLYVLVDMKGRTPHPFVVASLAVVPSYVSYLSALNYYGISDQVPRVVQMATTLRAEPFTYGGMRMEYHILRPDKFYGYGPEHFAPLEGLVALPEKALIDSFDRPALVGGGQEVVRLLLSSVRDIDIRRMRTLLKTFPSRSTISRICYILERNGHESDSLRSLGSKTYIPLVPGGKSEGNLDKGWNVYVDEGVIPRSPENS